MAAAIDDGLVFVLQRKIGKMNRHSGVYRARKTRTSMAFARVRRARDHADGPWKTQNEVRVASSDALGTGAITTDDPEILGAQIVATAIVVKPALGSRLALSAPPIALPAILDHLAAALVRQDLAEKVEGRAHAAANNQQA